MISLVLQSFGREAEYKRAIFTVLSYYAHVSLPKYETRTLLFTDQPDYFQPYLNGLPVEFVELTTARIKEMRGEIDFLHRIKIAVIEEAFSMSQGPLLYADSDTFFIADPETCIKKVTPDTSFMHEWEYQFESLRNLDLPAGKTFRAFLKIIEEKNFLLASGEEIKLKASHSSWNAGVMIFHPSHARFIPDVYALTSQFYPSTQNHASEQYAFSVILQDKTDLLPCNSIIYHYWYRIKKQIIDHFLNDRLSYKWAEQSLEQKLIEIKQWTTVLPEYFEEHELTIKDNAIQAFNNNQFLKGYHWAAKAVLKSPFNSKAFIKDTLYHIKRHITNK